MKILVAEDGEAQRELLNRYLRSWGYEVVVARDGKQAWAALQDKDIPTIAILDWMMPELEGGEICRRLRESPREPYTYVILLTCRDDINSLVEGLDAGADDYMVKPFEPLELRARIQAAERLVNLHAQLIDAREQIREQARRDAMLGLWNRGAIFDLLASELNRTKRKGSPLGVALADLDHFKQINDTHGHLVGDDVLRETARRFKASLRTYDAVGRFGGEEFLFVMPECDLEQATIVAERIRQGVAESPVQVGKLEFAVTVSLGTTCAQPDSNPSVDDLVRAADQALYRAKREGRDRVKQAPATDA